MLFHQLRFNNESIINNEIRPIQTTTTITLHTRKSIVDVGNQTKTLKQQQKFNEPNKISNFFTFKIDIELYKIIKDGYFVDLN